MQNGEKTLIIKFGGAAISSADRFSVIADLIMQRQKTHPRIVVVVSAMAGMTDQLISLAHEVHPSPPRREYDMLVSVGERISISLLAMALSLKGGEAISFTGSQSGIITSLDHGEAKITDVKPGRILAALEKGKIAIVAGFQGVSAEKEITTLGRGGSDTTAVALGIALKAERVEFYKDVEGIYDRDPKKEEKATLHTLLDHAKALEIILNTGGKVLHPRAVKLAAKNGLPLAIRSFKEEAIGTMIQSKATSFMGYEN